MAARFEPQPDHRRRLLLDEARGALEKLPTHSVICLDEFEALLTPAFDDTFFNALRSWANAGLLSWVTASAQPLETLAKKKDLTSPFFNILATVPLAGLSEREVSDLFDLANGPPHPLSGADRLKLRRLAANQPYHLQIVASKLWDMKAAKQVDYKELRPYLCRQPNPPALCHPPKRTLKSEHLAWSLALIALALLLGVLWWFIPAVGQAATAFWAWAQGFGDGMGGLILLTVIVGVVGGGLWQRKRLGDILRDLWEKLS